LAYICIEIKIEKKMIETGQSIISTKEYMELLSLKKAMKNEFVEFSYCAHQRVYAYSKDDFLKEYKDALNTVKEKAKVLSDDNDKNLQKLSIAKKEITTLTEKLEKANSNEFSFPSFLIGFLACIATYALAMFVSEIFK
jgi:hypothetical protein